MNYDKVQAIVLAAGKATRFNTGKTKLIEKICGQEMVIYITKVLQQLSIPTTVVVGFQAELVKQTIINHHNHEISFVTQEEQNGTGHAVMCTQELWNADNILILNGDIPLITTDIIEQLLQVHQKEHAAISFVTAHNDDTSLQGYGRVVQEGSSIRVVEAKEFDGDMHEYCCVNAGIYVVQKAFLRSYIAQLEANNMTGEFYLPQLIALASDHNYRIEQIQVPFDRVRGINTLKELWVAEQIKRSDIISYWMERGVRFYAAQAVHVDNNVHVGFGTYIGCGVHIINGSIIGNHCTIEPFSIIDNSIIADQVTVLSHCVLHDTKLEQNTVVGPFAHITHSRIDEYSTIGNFVEIKKTTTGKRTKAKHLSYLGDAQIGNNVNIGAGTITCNYNGITKHKTVIQDNAFIGSNNTLVAPITVGKQAYTAAGSTLTVNVPEQALAIGRARQINKENYVQKIQEKNKDCSEEISHPFIAAIKTNNDSTINE